MADDLQLPSPYTEHENYVRRRAALTVCRFAETPDEAGELLRMLDLDDPALSSG